LTLYVGERKSYTVELEELFAAIDSRYRELHDEKAERNELQLRIAKKNTLLEYEQERYGLQSANTEMMQKECGQLRDRITQLFGNLERQDQKMESIVSEMLESKDEASTARSSYSNQD
jgi:hypothetical protein